MNNIFTSRTERYLPILDFSKVSPAYIIFRGQMMPNEVSLSCLTLLFKEFDEKNSEFLIWKIALSSCCSLPLPLLSSIDIY